MVGRSGQRLVLFPFSAQLHTDLVRAQCIANPERELNFSRAATKLNIGQSALSKQIGHLHDQIGYELFVRQGRNITATAAGEVYAAQAKLSLLHAERAVSLSRATNQNSEIILHVGKSPYTDPYLITNVLSLRFPFFPNLSVTLTSKFAVDLWHDLLNGTLDLGVSHGYSRNLTDQFRVSGQTSLFTRDA